MWLVEQLSQPQRQRSPARSFLDQASVCPSAKWGLEDPDRLGFALRRLGNWLGATSDKVLTPKTRGVRSDTNLAHAPRVSWPLVKMRTGVDKISPECPVGNDERSYGDPAATRTPTRLPLASLPPTDFERRWRPRRRRNQQRQEAPPSTCNTW